MSETDRLTTTTTTAATTTTPGSPSIKRKPVPTPRSTLRKPSTTSQQQKILFLNSEDVTINIPRRRNLSFDTDGDSQGHVSVESRSPDDPEPRPVPDAGGEDILAALEKIPGVGSLRSLGSIGSSIPSLTLDRVKRESSSHSLGPSPSGALLERQKSAPTGTFHHTRRPWQVQQNQVLRIQPKLNGKSPPTSPSSTSPIGEEEDDLTTTSTASPLSSDRRDSKGSPKTESSSGEESEKSKIQERPLPELPSKNHPESIDIISTEQVYAALLTPEDHYCELTPQIVKTRTGVVDDKESRLDKTSSTVIRYSGKSQSTTNCNTMTSSHKLVNGFVTMTGTIRRGRHKPEKTVDIQLTLTPDHLKVMEKRVHDKYHDRCYCGLRRGPHVFILSLLSLPFVWIYSTFQAFVLGSMTLYNIFVYYNEERSCCHTLLSPFILLLYPFWIIPVTIFLGIYAALVQVSWYWDSWIGELRNPDKGFMNWICQKLNVPDCAPYQVVVMSAEDGTSIHGAVVI